VASPVPIIVGDRVAALERAMRRERAAREQAKFLLESKSREVFLVNEALTKEHECVQRRNAEIEKAHSDLQSTQVQLVQSENSLRWGSSRPASRTKSTTLLVLS
jgi:chromosome segregation ATPase